MASKEEKTDEEKKQKIQWSVNMYGFVQQDIARGIFMCWKLFCAYERVVMCESLRKKKKRKEQASE